MGFDAFLRHLHDKHAPTVAYLQVCLANAVWVSKACAYLWTQPQNDSLRTLFPELAPDVRICGPSWAEAAFGCPPEAVNLWIGNERSVTSFHKGRLVFSVDRFSPSCMSDADHYENIYVVVEGAKRFLLMPPCAENRLHFRSYPHAVYQPNAEGRLVARLTSPRKDVIWSPVEPDASDAAKKWPRFASPNQPPPLTCTVHKGELLYLPSLWYHYVTQYHKESRSVIAVNYWCVPSMAAADVAVVVLGTTWHTIQNSCIISWWPR